jgi:hypothetical protein
MRAIGELSNLSPFRRDVGTVPLPVVLRNTVFDSLFYDTTLLTPDEKAFLLASEHAREEGGMLLVHPGKALKEIKPFSRSADLVEEHPELEAVALPGVGSSVLGAACLARQVADAIEAPVVGIVAGYGAEDVVSEALGGWALFGVRNAVRAQLSAWKASLGLHRTPEEDRALKEKYHVLSTWAFVEEPESNTLLNVMLRARNLKVLVGHSKGALNIQNVLWRLPEEPAGSPDPHAQIVVVTLGCGASMPPCFSHVRQFIGTWDALGCLNTPWSLWSHESLRWEACRGHNLCCSSNPFHMPVGDLLREAIGSLRDGEGLSRGRQTG